MTDTNILSGLPVELIIAAYNAAPGNEIASGRFSSPESSAALAANTFGLFLETPQLLPPLPECGGPGLPPLSVRLEAELRFPWSGGTHSWVDVLVETSSALIGIESKRYEPYRDHEVLRALASGGEPYGDKDSRSWSQAYWRDWGGSMGPYEHVRNALRDKTIKFQQLDAIQLVKHAFALRTAVQPGRAAENKTPILHYIYAEPTNWPDGRQIRRELILAHRAELVVFAEEVRGAEVEFCYCSYRQLIASWLSAPDARLRNHAAAVQSHFEI